jgi:L,D-transpeptidase ErfK/SrfK
LAACPTLTLSREWKEEDFQQRALETHSFVPPTKGQLDGTETVVGQLASYEPTKGDTFYDIARYYDLGINEMESANPGIDGWIPAHAGKTLVIPGEWVLPCCNFTGLVINIPEMRLYYYPPAGKGQRRTVITYPVGLGRMDWRTPQGKFRIVEKTVNPPWVIPESIRKERIADKGFSESMIPGGSPDNPLGKYRLRTSLDLYGIHGTNIPWGVGMFVSHGCLRLYPEDIEMLYPRVPVGTSGEFIYETIKAGVKNGRVYVEAHEDIYGEEPGPWRHAVAVLEKQNLIDYVDSAKLERVVSEKRGYPVDVTADAEAPAAPLEETERNPAGGAPRPNGFTGG